MLLNLSFAVAAHVVSACGSGCVGTAFLCGTAFRQVWSACTLQEDQYYKIRIIYALIEWHSNVHHSVANDVVVNGREGHTT